MRTYSFLLFENTKVVNHASLMKRKQEISVSHFHFDLQTSASDETYIKVETRHVALLLLLTPRVKQIKYCLYR